MNERPSRLGLFLSELQRRHVWRAAITYAAVAFVLLQLGEIVFPAFGAPESALRLLVVLTLVGFPIVIALAWIYEITPQGIRRTESPAAEPGRRGRPGSLLPRVAFLLLTLIVAAVLAWWMMIPARQQGSGTARSSTDAPVVPVTADPGAAIRSLAVLPFENYSEGGEPDYFSAGMHEAVVSQLSQLSALRVVSRTTVMGYAGSTKSIPQIAEELAVDGVVEGSVLRVADEVRITVQLIHGPSDTHLWSKSYERDFADVIALQREVAQAIAQEIEAELAPEEETWLASVTPVEPEAHEAYLRGRWEEQRGTVAGYEEAIRYYQEAVDQDSSYAEAYTGLASSQLLLGLSQPDRALGYLPAAREAAERALTFDETSAEAHAILAEVDRALVEAADSLREELQVVKLDLRIDSLDTAAEDWVVTFTEVGRQARRIALAREAETQDAPAAARQVRVARFMIDHGQYAEAEMMLRQALEHDSDQGEAWEALERLRVIHGDYEGAIEVQRERAGRAAGASETEIAALERAVAERGGRGYWEWRLGQLEQRERRGESVSQVSYAAALASLGRHDEALERLERAHESLDRQLVSLQSDPTWDALRSDARFRQLVTQMRRVPTPPPEPREPS